MSIMTCEESCTLVVSVHDTIIRMTHLTLEERERELAVHLQTEHAQSPFASYFREIIYGGVDGIITTFAVVAGFSGAALADSTTLQLSSMTVLLFGVANLFADGVSMGLGSFLSIRSDQKLYASIRKKEALESEHNGDIEAYETVTLLMERGFVETDAHAITELYRKNPAYWVDFMMKYELKLSDPNDDNAFHSGVATFCAFIGFGAIPLVPFVVFSHLSSQMLFTVSTVSTLCALILLGFFKAKVTSTALPQSISEVVIVGTAAASVAYLVGSLFTL